MPTSVNGIGTHYYGRKDRSTVQGNCGFCKRFTQLSTYETREWICFVFIPIVPLRRYRILNDCGVCRRHHRLLLADFRQRLESEVAPLRAAVERRPLDAAAHLALVQGLIGYQLFPEAESAAREGLAKAPRDAKLNRVMAHLLAVRGDVAGATPYYRQAATSAPDDGETRFALGRHLFLRGETAEAARELAEAWRRDPGDRVALQLWGDALFAEKRWTEALDAYQQVIVRHPETASNRDLLRQMKAAKEALGFPLTGAERKAGRRWWPFGGRTKRTTLQPARRVNGRRIALVVGLVAGLAAVGALMAAFSKQRSAEVWFDNGLAKAVRVTLDGETFPLAVRDTVAMTVPPGAHAIVVADFKGREIERFQASIPRLDLLDALTTDRLFVYNVASARIYRRDEIGYAASAANRTYKASYVAFERFFEQRNVDYAFRPAPETLQVDSGSSTTRKVALNPSDLDANRLGVLWYDEGKAQDALKAFRQALAAEPCSLAARNNLLKVLPSQKETVAAARRWVIECPGVESHRAYQQIELGLGWRVPLLAEYQARLAAHPQDGASYYLYGHLLADPEKAIPLYRQAIQLQPNLAWSRLALGHSLLALERDAEAMKSLEAALRLPEHDPTVTEIYARAAVGAGALARARGVLEELEKSENGREELWHARWLLLLAGGELDAAGKVLRARELAGEEGEAGSWFLRAQLLRSQGDGTGLRKVLVQGRLRPDVAGIAATLLQEQALAAGRWKEAATAIDGLPPDEVSYPDRLLAAWGLRMAGDRQGAEERLAAIERELAAGAEGDAPRAAYLAMARHLVGRALAEELLASARRAGFQMVPLAYFVAGAKREAAGDTAGARPLFERAWKRSLDFGAPAFAAAARAKGAAPAS